MSGLIFKSALLDVHLISAISQYIRIINICTKNLINWYIKQVFSQHFYGVKLQLKYANKVLYLAFC